MLLNVPVVGAHSHASRNSPHTTTPQLTVFVIVFAVVVRPTTFTREEEQ